MSTITSIEWSDRTWGVVLGCDKISPGCTNCYAIRTAHRLKSNPNAKIKAAYADLTIKTPADKLNWSGLVRCLPERLQDPLHWKKPQRIFVNSQSDLFHEDVPFEFIDQVFAIMALCPQHTFQILTKRPERMLEYFNSPTRGYEVNAWAFVNALDGIGNVDPENYRKSTWPLPNVWLGVSVENQQIADERIPLLMQVPAAIRFLSCEPLLGPIDLQKLHSLYRACPGHVGYEVYPLDGLFAIPDCDIDKGRIHWVIVGGESGPSARLMEIGWARLLRDQCTSANVAFFFKQFGEYAPTFEREWEKRGKPIYERVGKKKAGRLLDGREWNEMPKGGNLDAK